MEVLRQVIETGDDVFLARQRGREVAAAVGFDEADQVRIATALSEIGRDVLGGGRPSTAVFEVAADGGTLTISVDNWPHSSLEHWPGEIAARRLMSEVR